MINLTFNDPNSNTTLKNDHVIKKFNKKKDFEYFSNLLNTINNNENLKRYFVDFDTHGERG